MKMQNQLLQSPFIYWACAAMGVAHIYLRDVQVMAHHVKAAVTQQFLQRKYIATAAQKLNRKGVAKPVRMAVLDAGAFTQPEQQMAQAIFVHRFIGATQKQRRIWILTILATGQIPPQIAAGILLHIHHPTLAALAQTHPNIAGVRVVVVDV